MADSRAFALLLGMATLSACSPYVYNQEITGFSNGVTAVVSSYQTGTQAVDASIVQQQQATEANARVRLVLLPGCDHMDPSGTPPKLPDCAVVALGTTAAPAPTGVETHLANAAPAFDALKAYAAALSAITAAADDTALTQATQSMTTAENGLASAVAKVAPAAAKDTGLVTPVSTLIGQGIAFYLDQRRYAVLRSTVPAMDDNVKVLGQTVQAALADIRAQQLAQLGPGLHSDAEPFKSAAISKLSVSDYQSKLAALEAKVAAYNQARAVDPAATVTTMVNAHHQLAVALDANTGQAMAVLTSVQTFAAAAAQLKTAVTAASTATTAASKAPATAK